MTQKIWLIDDDRSAVKPIADLLVRDWRTRVMKTTHDRRSSLHFASTSAARFVTQIVLDLDTPDDGRWVWELAKDLKRSFPNVPLIGTCLKVTPKIKQMVLDCKFNGLLCKDDVVYSYAAVLCQYERGTWLTTSAVWEHLPRRARDLGVRQVKVAHYEFGASWEIKQDLDIVRMVACDNQRYVDIADELNIAEGSIRRVITNMYMDLRLHPDNIDWDEVANYIPQSNLLDQLQWQYERKQHSAKSKLAFYLLTAPTDITSYLLH